MAGTAISELIFFIAAILISTTVAVSFIKVADVYSESISDEASMIESEIGSKMAIINDQARVPYDKATSNLTFYIKNTGASDLSIKDLVVSANGTASSGTKIKTRMMDGGSIWTPGDVVEVVFTVKNLRSGIDYDGWASTSGLSDGGAPMGSAQSTIMFRIRGP
jgi:archaellum component FlaG (FlaF/FlaG flagellin family)